MLCNAYIITLLFTVHPLVYQRKKLKSYLTFDHKQYGTNNIIKYLVDSLIFVFRLELLVEYLVLNQALF